MQNFVRRYGKIFGCLDLESKDIAMTDGIDPLQLLCDEASRARMLNEGLPADRTSTENGAIASTAARWPLFIDPQLQGMRWIKQREGESLMVLQQTQAGWIKLIGEAISNGDVVLMENLPVEIDSTLDPVLARAIFRKGRNYFIKLGGETIEYDAKFRLFLQTKLSNPHYKPEIFAQCTIINFIATEKGLEDQLLANVVNAERPELEKEKQDLQQKFNDYKMDLARLETELLERLSNAPVDILSDVPLIESPEATKKAATEIQEAVRQGQKTEIAINKAREVYRPAASEGALLYFILTSLCTIDHMYQYSLEAFLLFFEKAVAGAEKSEDTDARVNLLRSSIRWCVYIWVARGLREKDKITFLMQIALQLMSRGDLAEEHDQRLVSYLLRAPQRMTAEDNPLPWLSTAAWQGIAALAEMDSFANFPSDLIEASSRFEAWYNHSTPETEKLPLDWAQLDRTPFKKLLVLRCMRPDRLVAACRNWLVGAMPSGKVSSTLRLIHH